MIEEFKKYIKAEHLFLENEKILLAVSGGVDSVVMCHLFQMANFNFGIAHCNFQLRGTASDDDAKFVKSLAQKLNIQYFETSFDTQKYVADNKVSTQVAARDLRYTWLEKVRQENNFQFIATAHHVDDSLETILYNFTKGCGIKGLHGILPKKGKIIRPLLFSNKNQVLEFCTNNDIQYREDESNASDKYSRNLIRHHVVPILEKINPSLSKTTAENIERIKGTESLYNYAIEILRNEITESKQGNVLIYVKKLMQTPAPETLLFELLRPYGFNNSQTKQMIEAIEHQPGAIFSSKTHEVLLDRFLFIVKEIYVPVETEYFIQKSDTELSTSDTDFNFEIINNDATIFSKEKSIAQFDCFQLSFPLRLRRWEDGDTFCPLGMNGKHKKIQDFFTDLKLDRFEKEKIWILESGGEICWIVGHRLDDRFKVTTNTRQGFKIEIKTKEDL